MALASLDAVVAGAHIDDDDDDDRHGRMFSRLSYTLRATTHDADDSSGGWMMMKPLLIMRTILEPQKGVNQVASGRRCDLRLG